MGLETAALVMAGVAAASEVGKMSMQAKMAEEKEYALDLQAKQQTLQYQQKTLSNYDVLQKVLDAQTAQMTVRGTAFASPSFNAIQRATFNVSSKKQKNLDIENDIAQSNIESEKSNVKSQLYASLFGDVANIAMSAFNVANKMPTIGE